MNNQATRFSFQFSIFNLKGSPLIGKVGWTTVGLPGCCLGTMSKSVQQKKHTQNCIILPLETLFDKGQRCSSVCVKV